MTQIFDQMRNQDLFLLKYGQRKNQTPHIVTETEKHLYNRLHKKTLIKKMFWFLRIKLSTPTNKMSIGGHKI